MQRHLMIAGMLLAAGLGLSGCTDSVGYGDRLSSGYGYDGWYGDYYDPGSGLYVFDRYRRPYRWTEDQRRYWEARRASGHGRPAWGGFPPNGSRYGVPGNRRLPDAYHRGNNRVRAPSVAAAAESVPSAYRAQRADRPYPGQPHSGQRAAPGGARPAGGHRHR